MAAKGEGMKTVLLTGIGGSIGCHVLRHIMVETDWNVVGIDSFRHKGLTDRVYRVTKRHPETLPRFKILTHDLRAPITSMLSRQIGDVNYIINLAAISDVDASLVDPHRVITSNVAIATNILDFARNHYPEHFLHISTDEVYGPTDGTSAHKEWDPIVPSNPYSASKACQEAIAISYWRSFGVPLTIVNLMNNFGEMQSTAKFPAAVQRMVRRGEQVPLHRFGSLGYGTRFYIHSRNAADAMVFLLKRCPAYKHMPGRVDRPNRWNVVGDKQVDNKRLAEFIANRLGKCLNYKDLDCASNRPGHDQHYGLDGSKLAAEGWRSPHTFEHSMAETIKWYERNPEWLDPN